MSEARFRDIAQQLGGEPLFHMSLGSKELFHSNLLGYYAERFPHLADEAFGTLSTANDALSARAVHREKGHLDLVLELPRRNPVVVENKVFSLPDEDQLERYSAEAVQKLPGNPHLVLLSLADPHWPGDRLTTANGTTWHYLSYDRLKVALRPHVDRVSHHDPYDAETLRHYLELVTHLTELSVLVQPQGNEEPLELPASAVAALRPARVHDSARKLRASHIIRTLRTQAGWPTDQWAKSNFTNGATLLEAFTPINSLDHAGWQYQGGQFRLALILESLNGRGVTAKKEREERARELIKWFDFSIVGDVLGVDERTLIPSAARVGADGFNHYDPQFVYRYRKTPDLTVSQLVELGTRYVDRAKAFAA